ncbi:AI-2E family transporter [Hoeflea olei]|uniref:Permease n=1 Tax=Hoeflea olei TaxID=1480615 RepID=A0A1C1YUD6_9HYPH|nr:AI-2E family transporter [Hoeflea olei]OCW56950.1 hypothetical protein AWJ14_07270 [Hoeflea olei]
MTHETKPKTGWELASPGGRRRVSVCVVFAVLALLLLLLPGTLLMIFAGVLLAILLRTCGAAAAKGLHIPAAWGVAAVLLAAVVGVTLAGMAFAPSISAQLDELWRQVPSSLDSLRQEAERYQWAQDLIARIGATDLWSPSSRSAATNAVTSLFGYLGNAIILLFIAIYGALDPQTYRRGFLALFAPSIRERADHMLSRAVATLKQWLLAKLISMSVVGVLTGLGLWVVGVPLALLLGLIAGLLAFIPNFGPVLAAAPGVLLAVPDGARVVALVVGVYLAVQLLESYVITPLVQQRTVALPPLLVISAQLLFGSLFGLIGLALATPLTALALRLISDLYVKTYLEDDPPADLA